MLTPVFALKTETVRLKSFQVLFPSKNNMNANCECKKTLANDSFPKLVGNLILGIVKVSYKEISLASSSL